MSQFNLLDNYIEEHIKRKKDRIKNKIKLPPIMSPKICNSLSLSINDNDCIIKNKEKFSEKSRLVISSKAVKSTCASERTKPNSKQQNPSLLNNLRDLNQILSNKNNKNNKSISRISSSGTRSNKRMCKIPKIGKLKIKKKPPSLMNLKNILNKDKDKENQKRIIMPKFKTSTVVSKSNINEDIGNSGLLKSIKPKKVFKLPDWRNFHKEILYRGKNMFERRSLKEELNRNDNDILSDRSGIISERRKSILKIMLEKNQINLAEYLNEVNKEDDFNSKYKFAKNMDFEKKLIRKELQYAKKKLKMRSQTNVHKVYETPIYLMNNIGYQGMKQMNPILQLNGKSSFPSILSDPLLIHHLWKEDIKKSEFRSNNSKHSEEIEKLLKEF